MALTTLGRRCSFISASSMKKSTSARSADHGAKRMDGGIAINEWLVNEGYLVLDEKPEGVIPLSKAKINWGKTRVWGEGGYYSRIFMNVQGREPKAPSRQSEYEQLRDELIGRIEALPDHLGKPMKTRAYKPQDIYVKSNNVPPDLIVIWGDLYWRGVGSLGINALHTFENDTGPDDANHAQMACIFTLIRNAISAGAN